MLRLGTAATIAAVLAVAAPAASAHDDDQGATAGRSAEQLGKVNFPNSCAPAVQQKLLRGVALLHSFWYSQAVATFEDIGREDPSCAIAAWGFASMLMSNPLAGSGASPKDAARAQAAIEKGRTMGAKTQRERDYLEAVAAYYEDFPKRTERERQLARATAYESLAAKYPDDDEAQVFYAVYLSATQSLADQTYSSYLKAAGILEKQFVRHPDHPGVAHYLIHSYDAPPIAKHGVRAARLYAGIAPSAPHALHMPSHIFTRVGAWEDSAATNRRSADAAAKGGEPDEGTHAMDYMTYAYLQLARDSDARKVYEEAQRVSRDKVTPINPVRFTAPYALAAMDARIAVERGAWNEAAQLQPAATRFPFTEAMTFFARALGAARSGSGAAALKDVGQIAERRDALVAAKNQYWATEVEVMRLAASAWVSLAQGRNDEALGMMRQAADIEDKNEKHIVTPGRIVPARELLGDMLLELKRPADALREYEASQVREPNRFRGIAGAARAAADSGELAKARDYYSRLIELASRGEPRPEIAQAKAFLARN